MICELILTVKAYSPYDSIDKAYHEKHPETLTARGVDWVRHPYGIAGYLPNFPRNSTISVPGYCNGEAVTVDDTGGFIRQAKGSLIELRFPTSKEAKEWGCKTIKVRIFVPDKADK